MKSIKDLQNIRGKRVLMRVDFNEPIERGKMVDDTRIRAALPTLELLIKKGAKVILMTHFGRPTGGKKSVVSSQESGMITVRLGELLKKRVHTTEDWDFEKIGAVVQKMKTGQVLMLPNLRLHPGEEKNSRAFAEELATLGQLYVNEAFSVSHRAHASIVGVPKLLPCYAGLRLMEEISILGKVCKAPERPFVVLMGGGKITDKIRMIKSMVRRADAVLVGGALATHFYKAMGYGVGNSHIEPEGVLLAKKLFGNKKIILPRDVVVGKEDGSGARVVGISAKGKERRAKSEGPYAICSKPFGIWDIGPKTILEYARYIKSARTLVWNGPMGRYEVKQYSHGTLALGRLFASRSKGKAFGVIGGGETIDAMEKTGLSEYVDFISTGGGAMIAYLGGEKLPGIEALYGAK